MVFTVCGQNIGLFSLHVWSRVPKFICTAVCAHFTAVVLGRACTLNEPFWCADFTQNRLYATLVVWSTILVLRLYIYSPLPQQTWTLHHHISLSHTVGLCPRLQTSRAGTKRTVVALTADDDDEAIEIVSVKRGM